MVDYIRYIEVVKYFLLCNVRDFCHSITLLSNVFGFSCVDEVVALFHFHYSIGIMPSKRFENVPKRNEQIKYHQKTVAGPMNGMYATIFPPNSGHNTNSQINM